MPTSPRRTPEPGSRLEKTAVAIGTSVRLAISTVVGAAALILISTSIPTHTVASPADGDAADLLSCDGRPASIVGTPRSDHIFGTSGSDVIVAGDGDDSVSAGPGKDLVCLGRGLDVVRLGQGDDQAFGDSGDDSLSGGRGSDVLLGRSGVDLLSGGSGHDLLLGGPGQGLPVEALLGGPGDDLIDGGPGPDSAQFHRSRQPVSVDQRQGRARGEGHDVLANVERVVGSGSQSS